MAKCVRWLQEQVVALLLTWSVLQPWVAQWPCRLSDAYSQKAHLVTSAAVSIGCGGQKNKVRVHRLQCQDARHGKVERPCRAEGRPNFNPQVGMDTQGSRAEVDSFPFQMTRRASSAGTGGG